MLQEAGGERLCLRRKTCHIPASAYVIGEYAVGKIGMLMGPANEALMVALNAKKFIVE